MRCGNARPQVRRPSAFGGPVATEPNCISAPFVHDFGIAAGSKLSASNLVEQDEGVRPSMLMWLRAARWIGRSWSKVPTRA
jgi:hypothetical protein